MSSQVPSFQPSVTSVSDWEQAVAEISSQNAGEPDALPSGRAPSAGDQRRIPAGNKLTTFAEVVQTFMEHLEVIIHTILYERDIYPGELFMATRIYNTAVKMCRVPRVARYVREVVEQVGEQLLEVCGILLLSTVRPR
jgi:hypothetical protein